MRPITKLPIAFSEREQSRGLKRNKRSRPPGVRWGSVLLLVVVVVAMLTLATYNFSQSMTTELAATSMYTKNVQAKFTADSGLEFAASLIGDRTNLDSVNLINNPQLFAGRVVLPSQHQRAISRFSIIAPVEHDATNDAIRYGLMDESAKINLNILPYAGLAVTDIETMLMTIPNMSYEIIDSILDWIDTDDEANPYGAESETYQAMSPPYKAKNGPLESMDELLLVKGVTPQLLYGEDANRNGLLDPNENDGATSMPMDNADGVLDHGFIGYFTVLGRESNRMKDGRRKININDKDLKSLYSALVQEFPNDEKATAQFIIGYRLNGSNASPAISLTNPQPTTTTSSTSTTPPLSRIAQQVTDGIVELYLPNNGQPPKAGTVMTDDDQIDVSKGGPNPISSLWQLFGTATVRVNIGGTNKTLPSPWKDLSSISQTYVEMYDKLTVTKDDYLEGRININLARREVLMTIPTMTTQIADAILASQQTNSNGQASNSIQQQHSTTCWLYAENLVDAAGMQNIDAYITARGDVYRAQVLGFFDGGGPVSRLEAIIDGTQIPPRIISLQDLNELGRGYSRYQMFPIQ